MKQIHEHGYWLIKNQHEFDKLLSIAMIKYLKNNNCNTVVDIGCGNGSYVEHFIECGLDSIGYDGNPNTPEMSNNLCNIMDFSVDCDLPQFDWIVSLEIGEHIPKQYESIFINNLIKTAKNGIILSWGIIGQDGFGHVNCQNNDYIKNIFLNAGFINDIEAENELRKNSYYFWFKNTLMVFKKI